MGSKEDGIALTITQNQFRIFQFGVVTSLLVLGFSHYVYRDVYGNDLVVKLTNLFDLGRESSIPTAFSILNLLIASVLLFIIFRHSKSSNEPMYRYWSLLSLLFLILSIDEAASIHERASGIQKYVGVLVPMVETHSWVLYGAIFTVIVFLVFLPFLRQIERRTAVLMFLSGAIFVTGALGFEALGAWMLFAGVVDSETDFAYLVRRLFEEGFEMYGIALFNCTLFRYMLGRKFALLLC